MLVVEVNILFLVLALMALVSEYNWWPAKEQRNLAMESKL
jgi:uncharacterized membrane protein YdfJ with MMPL/SSD domain